MHAWRGPDVPDLPGRGPELRLLDSATRQQRVAASGPPEAGATCYACGITPYDATHIGHAATFTAWDLLVRSWRDAGRTVAYVQNVTDVDDPLLERADRDGENWRALADREVARYRDDMTALRVLPPTHLVGAVEALPVIEAFGSRLAERGALYDVDGDTYFARSADHGFGTVSGPGTVADLGYSDMTTLFAERGGDPDRAGKKDPLDCVVWRAHRPGEPAWDSAFGSGRPGWHVECAAIAAHYLGTAFDVQAGGSDLAFPHHEMSASHARVALGAPDRSAPPHPVFARVYAHAGMVGLDGQKMSKSLGNLVFVSRLLAEGEDPTVVRLALLAHHYRSDWEWTDAGLAAARRRLDRWREAVRRSPVGGPVPEPPVPEPPATAAEVPPGPLRDAGAVLAEVRTCLADDLDAPGALAAVDRWADAALTEGRGDAASSAAAARLVRDTADALLGIAV